MSVVYGATHSSEPEEFRHIGLTRRNPEKRCHEKEE